jgi:hypothetical protein
MSESVVEPNENEEPEVRESGDAEDLPPDTVTEEVTETVETEESESGVDESEAKPD